ncbi:MAG TPA: hypothetical protein VFU35_15460 [Jatrophihabitans sp.]|nr:hypothetical protein [Jatrophihabitans sp.]
MSDVAVRAARVDRSLLTSLLAAVVVGAALVAGARIGATALLGVIAVVQAVLAITWVLGVGLPGRWGALVLAAGAAAAADVTVSVWPHGRLGVLIGVFGLAIPAMFVHQLTRGAARVQLVASLSGIAVLLFAEISLAALPQLRHELTGRVAAAAVLVVAVALVAGYLLDLVVPVPRIDPEVARGLPALLVSIGAGTLAGYLMLRTEDGFGAGRSALVGLVLGAAAALLAVAAGFVVADAPAPRTAAARALRPVIAAVFPFAVLAPVAFLSCLAVRS